MTGKCLAKHNCSWYGCDTRGRRKEETHNHFRYNTDDLNLPTKSYSHSFQPSLHHWCKDQDTSKILLGVCICVSEWHMCAGTLQRKKGVLDPLKLELQGVVIHLTWVLGMGVRSTGRTSTLNSWAVSPTEDLALTHGALMDIPEPSHTTPSSVKDLHAVVGILSKWFFHVLLQKCGHYLLDSLFVVRSLYSFNDCLYDVFWLLLRICIWSVVVWWWHT